jgi:hypothetical protein
MYCWLTNYRFRKLLTKEIKPFFPNLKTEAICAKAGASLTSVSAFLGFVVAAITWLAAQEFGNLFRLSSEEAIHQVIWWTALSFVLPYSSFWFERYISAVSVETDNYALRRKKRRWRSSVLVLSLVASLFLFLGAPALLPTLNVFRPAFSLAGAIMTALSVVFLLFALEFYDAATSWHGDVDTHFHLASIASNSYLLGVSLALMGASLSVCLSKYYFIGRLLAACTLMVLVMMTEIERALWDLDKEEDRERQVTA